MLLAVRISGYGCTWEVWRALKKLELLSAAHRATLTLLSCSPSFPRASITRYTHAKHEPILNRPHRSFRRHLARFQYCKPKSVCMTTESANRITNRIMPSVIRNHTLHVAAKFQEQITFDCKVFIPMNVAFFFFFGTEGRLICTRHEKIIYCIVYQTKIISSSKTKQSLQNSSKYWLTVFNFSIHWFCFRDQVNSWL